jgi:hypothetical protein
MLLTNLALGVLTTALLVASQSLPLVSRTKLQILPLPTLIHLIVVAISSTLHSGKFLCELSASIVRQDEHHVHIPVSQPLVCEFADQSPRQSGL